MLGIHLVLVNYFRFLDGLNFQGAEHFAGQISNQAANILRAKLKSKNEEYILLCVM